jgi:hypothetical protein
MKYLLLLLLIGAPVSANDYSFTSGSMTQTTTATQEVTEVIAIEKFGGAVQTWNGDNVEASGSNITLGTTAWTIVDETQPWQLEVMTRAAGVIETQDINRTIETTTTTNTLSVFSQ